MAGAAGGALRSIGGFALKRGLPLLGAWEGGQLAGGYINQGINWGLSKIAGRETTLGGYIYDKTHRQENEVSGEIRVRIDQEGRLESISAKSTNRDVPFSVDNGLTMAAPWLVLHTLENFFATA